MNLSELVTDPYNRRARLQPALMTLLSLAVVALVLYPGVESKAATLLGIVAYFGGAAWLTQVGRERGKRLEKDLFDHWGGMLRRDKQDENAATIKMRKPKPVRL